MKLLFFMDVLIFGGCEKMIVEITNELLKKIIKLSYYLFTNQKIIHILKCLIKE